jgi:hypothetical protein
MIDEKQRQQLMVVANRMNYGEYLDGSIVRELNLPIEDIDALWSLMAQVLAGFTILPRNEQAAVTMGGALLLSGGKRESIETIIAAALTNVKK